ncbi:hypothetical protein [Flaviaesturariibacter aridisoli]|uniref:Uncharacterized protein n=1 Tax=Flaviaesturariibacter aridisoli TaxID=2545761 RepID=A0A4R4DVB2_9BACT|nr:hypothetical protein [Flaviaesturariibacter aridisoli]TCZ67358.1 hypothetical protein E0486_15750 [Flaviaesturariibacter aridisoli]
MKLATLCLLVLAAVSVQGGCKKNSPKPAVGCYKGRLEVKGLCMNYTVSVLEGAIDTALVESSWRDEQTGISYRNVFGLGSPCTFPAGIRQGDAFYFTIDSSSVQNCAVCLAYYPTPPKKLAIRVQTAACSQP